MKRLDGEEHTLLRAGANQMVPGNRFGSTSAFTQEECARFEYGGAGTYRMYGALAWEEPGHLYSAYPLSELVGICLDGETR